MKTIALVGNPNCGKTTLFNRLTGANQTIGNWPGVTVEQHHGVYIDPFAQTPVKVIDLPGCYSLIVTDDMALDERITCDYIASVTDTIYINIVDAAHLSRDLYVTLQLLEKGVPVILALNCYDVAQAMSIDIDSTKLSAKLGCQVVFLVAKTGQGVAALQDIIGRKNIANAYTTAKCDQASDVEVAQYRNGLIKQIIADTVTKKAVQQQPLTKRIDNIVLHPIYGPIIFIGVMYAMFTCAINLGGWLQAYVEQFSETILITKTQQALTWLGIMPWLNNLLTEGIGRGISITVTFMPVLGAMFICLGILESSGYMTRAAFIVDRLMSCLGLSGKSFVPMIVGFGCNVPAVMGARTLSSRRERILTIMMTPFMSCSARLAIYAIFVAAFFPHGGQNIIFSLYVIGIAVAVVTALVLRKAVAPNHTTMALMEMPDYRWPMLNALLRQAWHRLKSFIMKAGVFIVILTVLINGLGYEFLASVGKFLTPLFAPIGISADNWPATVGLVTGLVAKEAVVGTLNAFYANEADMVRSFGGVIPAYAYLLFTLLYFPCVSVVAVISKELNIKWALFSVVWSTGLAYLIAALFYQTATLNSWVWITGLSLLLVGFFGAARWFVGQQQSRALRKVVPTAISVN